ncbi:hypothetical protein N7462_006532 [Penicillium macrosclerotiorum]|uniref:uncharacterized protein n=1 Tax=Penicillium macrosclerotiorum TaxID=303699 RepID=UPI00254744DD|nr:uncharacterized protein N7462_006532 [Penicillium macrosclerotiorum]KAJ5683367.1 hypothetical protein N7462_006532 [Penicillium macrosclerotiorum]
MVVGSVSEEGLGGMGKAVVEEGSRLCDHLGKGELRPDLNSPTANYLQLQNLKAEVAMAQLKDIRYRQAIDAEIRHAANKAFSSPLWMQIEGELKKAGDALEDASVAIQNIMEGKIPEAIEALRRDRDREWDRKIKTIEELKSTTKNIKAKLNLALEELIKNKGRITEREVQLAKDVEKLKGELETRPFEDDYRHKLQDHEAVEAEIRKIQKALTEIGDGIDNTVEEAQRRVRVMEQGVPTVKLIHVVGSTDVFITNKPLTFKAEGRWDGKPVHCEVQWAPGWSVAELYDQISSKLFDAAASKLMLPIK